MSTRRDYWHDPAAPEPTRVIPGAAALVTDDAGRILLQRRRDSGRWSLPGGVMEVGERLNETAVREVREETGLDVEITGLLGIYTDPGHVIAYSDGEVRQEFVVAYRARPVGGDLRISDESTEVCWIAPANLDDVDMHESVRLRIGHHLSGATTPYLG